MLFAVSRVTVNASVVSDSLLLITTAAASPGSARSYLSLLLFWQSMGTHLCWPPCPLKLPVLSLQWSKNKMDASLVGWALRDPKGNAVWFLRCYIINKQLSHFTHRHSLSLAITQLLDDVQMVWDLELPSPLDSNFHIAGVIYLSLIYLSSIDKFASQRHLLLFASTFGFHHWVVSSG